MPIIQSSTAGDCRNGYATATASSGCDIPVIPPLGYPRETLGNGEIRVRGLNGKIYVAATLILHYVSAHQYLPPDEFLDAVATDLPQPVLRDGVWR